MSDPYRFLSGVVKQQVKKEVPMNESLLANVTAWTRRAARVLVPAITAGALSAPGAPVLADVSTSQAPGYPAYVTRDEHAMASNFSEPHRQTWIDHHVFRGFPPNTPVQVRAFGLLRAAEVDINSDTWIDLAFRVNGNDHLQPIFDGERMSGRTGPRSFDATFTTSTNSAGELQIDVLLGQCTTPGFDPRCGAQNGHIEVEVMAPEPR